MATSGISNFGRALAIQRLPGQRLQHVCLRCSKQQLRLFHARTAHLEKQKNDFRSQVYVSINDRMEREKAQEARYGQYANRKSGADAVRTTCGRWIVSFKKDLLVWRTCLTGSYA